MSGDKRISGWVNPLAFLEVDEPWASATKGTPDVDAVLRFLCPANEELNLTTILARYKEISTEACTTILGASGTTRSRQTRMASTTCQSLLYGGKLSFCYRTLRHGC